MNYIIIDVSYWIFYRYFALIQYFKHSKSIENLNLETLYENSVFVQKFDEMIKNTIKNVKKKLKITKQNSLVIAACDCPRLNIWRNEFYNHYKETRIKNNKFVGIEFFKHVYNSNLLNDADIDYIFKYDKLEGDDIIAILKNYIRKTRNDDIYIIANDYDYLQLIDEHTHVINLQNKNLLHNKNMFPDGNKNLFFKIVQGDKSDNINPLLKKCTKETIEYYYENPDIFENILKEKNLIQQYELNKKLISFSEIPIELKNDFIKHIEPQLKVIISKTDADYLKK
tara:strand:- start:8643 stop:9491 length:849 start_codon:yes stop_codon:yes gene_type:complete